MKFTTLIPTTRNDGSAVRPSVLARLIQSLWRPFGGMTNEGLVTGHWIDDDTEFQDVCVKVSIECDRDRLHEAIKAVRQIGHKLGQRAMYFEVSGYDGVQILRVQ
ncbi:MAG: hypothetical protein HYS12_01065 [Planctomycetes bacterium]|nr:hypothetical protein [Planctomycetota bacterium]